MIGLYRRRWTLIKFFYGLKANGRRRPCHIRSAHLSIPCANSHREWPGDLGDLHIQRFPELICSGNDLGEWPRGGHLFSLTTSVKKYSQEVAQGIYRGVNKRPSINNITLGLFNKPNPMYSRIGSEDRKIQDLDPFWGSWFGSGLSRGSGERI